MFCAIVKGVALLLNRVFFIYQLLSDFHAIGVFPGRLGLGGVVLTVFYHAAALYHQRFQAFFAELFGCPATGNARSNHNGVVDFR